MSLNPAHARKASVGGKPNRIDGLTTNQTLEIRLTSPQGSNIITPDECMTPTQGGGTMQGPRTTNIPQDGQRTTTAGIPSAVITGTTNTIGTAGSCKPQPSKVQKAATSFNDIHVVLLNARSVNNKADALNDFICSSNIDILCITETWITEDTPTATINALVPDGYGLSQCHRNSGRRGGGVAIVHKNLLQMTFVSNTATASFSQFEHLQYRLKYCNKVMTIIVIYRPPSLASTGFNANMFLDELTDLLGHLSQTTKEYLILGDINLHLDDLSNNVKIR